MLTKNQYVIINATLKYLFELLFGYVCLDGKMTLRINLEHWICRCFFSCLVWYNICPPTWAQVTLFQRVSEKIGESQRRRCEQSAAGFNSHQKTPGWIWERWESRVHFNLHFPLVRNEDHKQQIYDFALKIERPKWNMVPWLLTNKVIVLPGCLKLFWIPNSGNLSFEQRGACFLNNAYSMETTSAAIAIRSPLLEIASCNKKVVTCTGVGF